MNLTRIFIVIFPFFAIVHELDAQAQTPRELWETLNLIRREKFDIILPDAMRDNAIDMWIHAIQRGNPDPLATGVKIANEKMNVVITGGDGDGYGIGVGHFIHSMRRNLDLTYVVMNNQIYGLTTGQASATSPLGLKTKSTPKGNQEKELNPLALALVSGATFVARAYSGQVKQLSSIISQAIKHRGFSIIDVYSPCVTYYNTYEVFKKIIYKIDDEKPDRDLTDFNAAMDIVSTSEERIPVGIFYQVNQSIYEESDPVLKRGPLVDQTIGLSKDTFEKLLAETM